QLRDAISSFASETKTAARVCVTGAGFYCDVARQWSYLLHDLAGRSLEVIDPFRFRFSRRPWSLPAKYSGIVLLSGSRCRLKRTVHENAGVFRKSGLSVFSITDGSDRELTDLSTLAVLLPVMSEMPGSILALIILAGATAEAMLPE